MLKVETSKERRVGLGFIALRWHLVADDITDTTHVFAFSLDTPASCRSFPQEQQPLLNEA
jgi:hypothetical protein